MKLAKFSTKTVKKTIDATIESVEVDMDFTQLYDCFLTLAMGIKGTTNFQMFFFLLRVMGRDNIAVVGKRMLIQFNAHRVSRGQKPISEQALYTSIKALVKADAIRKMPPNRGAYFINPFAAWKAGKTERIEYLREDSKPGTRFAVNPINLLLNDPDHEYKLQTMTQDMTDEDVQTINEEIDNE